MTKCNDYKKDQEMHTASLEELLSAYMDDSVSDTEECRLLQAVIQQPKLLKRWEKWHRLRWIIQKKDAAIISEEKIKIFNDKLQSAFSADLAKRSKLSYYYQNFCSLFITFISTQWLGAALILSLVVVGVAFFGVSNSYRLPGLPATTEASLAKIERSPLIHRLSDTPNDIYGAQSSWYPVTSETKAAIYRDLATVSIQETSDQNGVVGSIHHVKNLPAAQLSLFHPNILRQKVVQPHDITLQKIFDLNVGGFEPQFNARHQNDGVTDTRSLQPILQTQYSSISNSKRPIIKVNDFAKNEVASQEASQ